MWNKSTPGIGAWPIPAHHFPTLPLCTATWKPKTSTWPGQGCRPGTTSTVKAPQQPCLHDAQRKRAPSAMLLSKRDFIARKKAAHERIRVASTEFWQEFKATVRNQSADRKDSYRAEAEACKQRLPAHALPADLAIVPYQRPDGCTANDSDDAGGSNGNGIGPAGPSTAATNPASVLVCMDGSGAAPAEGSAPRDPRELSTYGAGHTRPGALPLSAHTLCGHFQLRCCGPSQAAVVEKWLENSSPTVPPTKFGKVDYQAPCGEFCMEKTETRVLALNARLHALFDGFVSECGLSTALGTVLAVEIYNDEFAWDNSTIFVEVVAALGAHSRHPAVQVYARLEAVDGNDAYPYEGLVLRNCFDRFVQPLEQLESPLTDQTKESCNISHLQSYANLC